MQSGLKSFELIVGLVARYLERVTSRLTVGVVVVHAQLHITRPEFDVLVLVSRPRHEDLFSQDRDQDQDLFFKTETKTKTSKSGLETVSRLRHVSRHHITEQ